MALDALARALRHYVPHVLEATGTPGLTVAIADHTGETLVCGFGLADLAARTDMVPDAVMPGGSLSKLYVATAVMQLAERGCIDIYSPITRYITDVPIHNSRGRRAITPYDLLTHRSGLATDTIHATLERPLSLPDYLAARYGAQRSHEYRGAGPLWTSPVGERYQYSNLGMATLGHLISVANPDGDSFTDYLNNHIFQPLGMVSSCIPEINASPPGPAHLISRRATGYARFGRWCIPTPILHSGMWPSIGLLTTAQDHVQLLTAFLHGGRAGDATVLQPHTLRHMLAPHGSVVYPGELIPMHTGLGVQIRNVGNRDVCIGHDGAYPFGWWGDSRAYPELGFAVVVLSNVWDMIRWVNPLDRIAPGLVADFAAGWMSRDEADPPMSRHSGPWRSSYAMGLLMGERLRGLLGIEPQLSDDLLSAMVSGTRSLPATSASGAWDTVGFTAGLAAMNSVDASPSAIRAFLASKGCPLGLDELNLHALDFGASRAHFPVPLAYWADRHEDSPPGSDYLDATAPSTDGPAEKRAPTSL